MLFFIFVALIVIGAVVGVFAMDNCYDTLESAGAWAFCIGLFATIVSVIFFLSSYIGVDGYVAKYKARHDALVYQYENDIYDNDNDLGKRELMEDIRKYNEDLAWDKENQDDLWIGIYIPNIYDQFEFIKLEKED